MDRSKEYSQQKVKKPNFKEPIYKRTKIKK